MARLHTTIEKVEETVILIKNNHCLHLDDDELDALHCILWRVGGSSKRSKRKYSDEIYKAICDTISVSTLPLDPDGERLTNEAEGHIVFKDF